MADQDNDGEDEFAPTPEQAEAYRQRTLAAIGLGRFDKFCAGLHSSQMKAHATQPNCIVVSTLGTSMAVVEYADGQIGIAVPPVHASWLDMFPFDFICATAEEVFFISKGFRWLNEDIPPIGISLGAMVPSEMLAKMCNQKSVRLFMVDGPDLSSPRKGTSLRAGNGVDVFHSQQDVPMFETRQHIEQLHRKSVFDPQAELQSHFVG